MSNYTIVSNGIKFSVDRIDGEIIFCDTNGDTITWDDTSINWTLVQDMIAELTAISIAV